MATSSRRRGEVRDAGEVTLEKEQGCRHRALPSTPGWRSQGAGVPGCAGPHGTGTPAQLGRSQRWYPLIPKDPQGGKGKEESCLPHMTHLKEKQASVASGDRQAGKCCSLTPVFIHPFFYRNPMVSWEHRCPKSRLLRSLPCTQELRSDHPSQYGTHSDSCSSFWHHPRAAAGPSPFGAPAPPPVLRADAEDRGSTWAC